MNTITYAELKDKYLCNLYESQIAYCNCERDTNLSGVSTLQ